MFFVQILTSVFEAQVGPAGGQKTMVDWHQIYFWMTALAISERRQK